MEEKQNGKKAHPRPSPSFILSSGNSNEESEVISGQSKIDSFPSTSYSCGFPRAFSNSSSGMSSNTTCRGTLGLVVGQFVVGQFVVGQLVFRRNATGLSTACGVVDRTEGGLCASLEKKEAPSVSPTGDGMAAGVLHPLRILLPPFSRRYLIAWLIF